MTDVLAKLDKATQMLAAAKNLDEVKSIMDIAKAARVYARAAKLGLEVYNHAAEVKARAERKAGEFLQQLERDKGGRPNNSLQDVNSLSEYKEVLDENGIGYVAAHRWQLVAEIPEEEFENQLSKMRGERPITTSAMVTYSRREKVIKNLKSVEKQKAKEILGVFDVIVIDPPWPMEKIEREVRENQVAFDYPPMSIEEIGALKIPYAEDCHVFLWTTQRFLPIALKIMGIWDLEYVCTFNWHKAGGYQVVGLPQYNNEFAIYGRMGSPIFVDTKDFKTSFEGKRGKHSEKPEEFYETLRRVTAGRRLDMFNRRIIEGFEGWGKESK